MQNTSTWMYITKNLICQGLNFIILVGESLVNICAHHKCFYSSNLMMRMSFCPIYFQCFDKIMSLFSNRICFLAVSLFFSFIETEFYFILVFSLFQLMKKLKRLKRLKKRLSFFVIIWFCWFCRIHSKDFRRIVDIDSWFNI